MCATICTPGLPLRAARLARRVGPDMAYLNKTLARIAGVEPEEGEPPQADEDQDFALTTGEAPLRASRSFSNEAPRPEEFWSRWGVG
ncbi:hypothetical protein FKX98_01450 [Bifidobacterium breve]|nr:hypothetical protein [Bifidobacterium breve]